MEKKKYESPAEGQVLKTLISTGDSYFKIQSLKIGINRQPPFVLRRIIYSTVSKYSFSLLPGSAHPGTADGQRK